MHFFQLYLKIENEMRIIELLNAKGVCLSDSINVFLHITIKFRITKTVLGVFL